MVATSVGQDTFPGGGGVGGMGRSSGGGGLVRPSLWDLLSSLVLSLPSTPTHPHSLTANYGTTSRDEVKLRLLFRSLGNLHVWWGEEANWGDMPSKSGGVVGIHFDEMLSLGSCVFSGRHTRIKNVGDGMVEW